MKIVDEKTLELKEYIKKDYVYVLNVEASFEYDEIHDIYIYKDFKTTLANFHKLRKLHSETLREYIPKDDLTENLKLNEESEQVSYLIYEDDAYDKNRVCIEILKKEVE